MPNTPDGRKTSLETVVNSAINTALLDVHTILPAQVISFDPQTQTADLQPQLKRNINGKLVNLPVLMGVPIRFLRSSNFSISFPLAKDDEVAVYIIERSIDNWFSKGGLQATNDVRKFDLSDAYAVPTLYSQAQKISNFDPDNMVIQSTSAKITLKPTGEIVIDSNTMTLNGDLTVTGTVSADIVEATTSLKAGTSEVVGHVHGGVTSGSSSTLPLA
jgi:hypothetical protein